MCSATEFRALKSFKAMQHPTKMEKKSWAGFQNRCQIVFFTSRYKSTLRGFQPAVTYGLKVTKSKYTKQGRLCSELQICSFQVWKETDVMSWKHSWRWGASTSAQIWTFSFLAWGSEEGKMWAKVIYFAKQTQQEWISVICCFSEQEIVVQIC